jgi:hypothetical protein
VRAEFVVGETTMATATQAGVFVSTATKRPVLIPEEPWEIKGDVANVVFGCANPPDTMWPERPGSGPGWVDSREFYFRRVEDQIADVI